MTVSALILGALVVLFVASALSGYCLLRLSGRIAKDETDLHRCH